MASSDNGNDSAAKSALSVTCTRLRDFENLARSSGWAVDCRQLGPGRARIDANASVCCTATIIDAKSSHRLEATGRTRSDMVSMVLPAGNTRILLNGYSIGAGDAVALPPDYPVVAWSSEEARLLLVFLPVSSVATAGFFDPESRAWLLQGKPLHLDKNSIASEKLRAKISAKAPDPSAPGAFVYRVERASELRELHWQTAQPTPIDETSYAIIKQSIAFVEAHLAENISIKGMSLAAATSLSKLERTFRDVLDMSPSQYVLARRLASARRTLSDADASTTSVATIALDNGFNHLGRFSGAYRRYFDELPRETLQQQFA